MSYTEIKREPEWTEEMFTPCEYSVKDELVWQDSETGFEGAWGGLYADHEVKGELVLGPERLQPPDKLFSTPDISWKPSSDFQSVGSEPKEQTYSNMQTIESIVLPATHTGSKLFSCYVRLERCPVLSELNKRLFNINRKMAQKETNKNHLKPRRRSKCRFKNRKRRVEEGSLSELTKRLINKHGKIPPVSPQKETSHKNHYKPKYKKKYKLEMFQRTVEPDLMEYTYRVNKATQNAHRIHLRGAGTSHAMVMNGNAYVCKVCMEEFADQPSLDEHSQTHKGEIQYACKVCERQFATISYFEAHVCKNRPINYNSKIKIIQIANNINAINSDGDLMGLENNKSDVTTPTNTGNIDPGDKSNLNSDLTELEKKTHNSNEKKPVKAKNTDSKLKGKAKNCTKKLKSKSESALKKDETKTQNADVKTSKTKKSAKKQKKTKLNLDLLKYEIKTNNLDAMKLIKVKMSDSDKKPKTKSDPEVKKAKRQINQLLRKLKKDPEDAKYVVSYISTFSVATGLHLLDHSYHRAAQDARFVGRTALATYGRL